MINILYLLKTLDTNEFSELTAVIDASPLDMNLSLWRAVNAGEIELDEKRNRIKALKTAEPWYDQDLSTKLMEVIRHYAANGSNITAGRINSYMKDLITGRGYPAHEYLMTMQYLIDKGMVVENTITVPKTKKRPFHRFIFLGLPENDNQKMNSRAIHKWITGFEKTKVK